MTNPLDTQYIITLLINEKEWQSNVQNGPLSVAIEKAKEEHRLYHSDMYVGQPVKVQFLKSKQVAGN